MGWIGRYLFGVGICWKIIYFNQITGDSIIDFLFGMIPYVMIGLGATFWE